MEIAIGDIVLRISHGQDIYFKVESIDSRTLSARLRGIDIRLCADAPLADLVKPGISEVANFRAKSLRLRAEIVSRASSQARLVGRDKKTSFAEIPGVVLHLDGDAEYMETCRRAYGELGLVNHSFYVPEERQGAEVEEYLKAHNPDTLVLTGHDGMIKGYFAADGPDRYHNSRHFIEAVKVARRYRPSKDSLVIFAGACQSWYQGLMAAGANYASSPQRVLIHSLDPVMVVQKVAYTPVTRTANIQEIIEGSVTGPTGIGGIETRGQFRLGLPKIKK